MSEVYGIVTRAFTGGYKAELRFVANDTESYGRESLAPWLSLHSTLWGAKRGARQLVRRYRKAKAFKTIRVRGRS